MAGTKPLPLRTINRLEKGNVLTYRPILRPSEERRGEIAIVLIPFDKTAGETMAVLEPRPANRPASDGALARLPAGVCLRA